MKKWFGIFALILALPCFGADQRIVATITVTNLPSAAEDITVNGDTRTWRATVTLPASEVLIDAAVEGNATNLYTQFGNYPFSGFPVVGFASTNIVKISSQVNQALAVSISGTWASVTLETNPVVKALGVYVPLNAGTASVGTNMASQLVSGISSLATNSFTAGSTAIATLVQTTGNQSVAGNKTFTGANSFTGSTWNSGAINGTEMQWGVLKSGETNTGILFEIPGFTDVGDFIMHPDEDGYPSIYFRTASGTNNLALYSDGAVAATPRDGNILTVGTADFFFNRWYYTNTWTGPNTFTAPGISNSVIGASILTNNIYWGTLGWLTGGLLDAGTLSNYVHRGSAFQSYNGSDDTTLQVGKSASATGGSGTALGKSASATGSSSTALGVSATVSHNNATAIGKSATTTADSQLRLGTSSEYASIPGNAQVGGMLAVGYADGAAFPTGMTKGFYLTNGAAASADPANGIASWSASGKWFYRQAGSGVNSLVDNATGTVTGSGSDYSLTSSYAQITFGSSVTASLPTAGTYLLFGSVAVDEDASNANDAVSAKLYNSTDASDISGSEQTISSIPATKRDHLILIYPVTITGNKTIHLYGKNATAARGTIKSTETSLTWVRLF